MFLAVVVLMESDFMNQLFFPLKIKGFALTEKGTSYSDPLLRDLLPGPKDTGRRAEENLGDIGYFFKRLAPQMVLAYRCAISEPFRQNSLYFNPTSFLRGQVGQAHPRS